MKQNKNKLEIFKKLINLDYKTRTLNNYAQVKHRINNIFRDVNFVNKKILDIGSGKGLASIYLALNGAKKVIGIEPMLEGCSENSLSIFKKNIRKIGLVNCTAVNSTLQNFSAKQKSFDIIVSIHSINHLNENFCSKLHNDKNAWEYYLSLMKKVHSFLRPGGVFIIVDCSRHNFFSQLYKIGIKNPMAHSIDWNIHQSPKTWRRLLSNAGFSMSYHWWHIPYKFLGVYRLFSNSITSWFTLSYFVIHAYK